MGVEANGEQGDDREANEEPRPDPTVGDQPAITYSVLELKVSDRLVLDRILDRFQPGWTDDAAPGGTLAFVADGSTFAFGAFRGDEVAGYAWGYRLRLPTGHKSMLLHDLEVGEGHRRQGLGGLLMQAVVNLARREGCVHLWVVAESDNEPAIELYRATGGHSASWPDGDVVFEWMLARHRA